MYSDNEQLARTNYGYTGELLVATSKKISSSSVQRRNRMIDIKSLNQNRELKVIDICQELLTGFPSVYGLISTFPVFYEDRF